MIKIDEYPELKLITWNIHLPKITEKEAYDIYRVNWRHVHENMLTDEEKALIKKLCEKYGDGIPLTNK